MTVLDTGFLQSDWEEIQGTIAFNATGTFTAGGFMQSFILLDGGATPDAVRFTFGAARAGSSDFWTHFRAEVEMNTTSDQPFVVFRGGGTDLFRIQVINASQHWMVEYWNGSSWTQVGSDITVNINNSQIDIHINMDNSTGVFDVYQDGVQRASLAGGDTIFDTPTDLDDVEFYAPGTSASFDVQLSDFLTADVQTTEYRISEEKTLSSGTRQEWEGPETNIDDDGIWDAAADSTWIGADANAERATYNMAAQDPVFDTDHDVIGVYQVYRARKTSVGSGLKVQAAIYKSATDYTGGAAQTLLNGFEEHQHLWAVDPTTSSPWADAAAIEAAEFGFKAVT